MTRAGRGVCEFGILERRGAGLHLVCRAINERKNRILEVLL